MIVVVSLDFEVKSDFNPEKAFRMVHREAQLVLLELMHAVERHAKRLAPVDTGRLRASIIVIPRAPSDKIVCVAGVDYAVYQEYGTYKMKAQPFMRPAEHAAIKVDFPIINKKYGGKFSVK